MGEYTSLLMSPNLRQQRINEKRWVEVFDQCTFLSISRFFSDFKFL
jgi:hypothetical protein